MLIKAWHLDNPDVTWRTGDMSDRCVAELKASRTSTD